MVEVVAGAILEPFVAVEEVDETSKSESFFVVNALRRPHNDGAVIFRGMGGSLSAGTRGGHSSAAKTIDDQNGLTVNARLTGHEETSRQ